MKRKILREIINVHDRQAPTYFTHVNERAPFEKIIRRSLNPSGLIERSPKEPPPIEKMLVHLAFCRAADGCSDSRLNDLNNEFGRIIGVT